MARRRMISAELMRSDEFLALPGESQLLYVHLLVEADDDGFLLGKHRIVTMLGLEKGAFEALVEAGFVLQFSSGAAVIAHWPVCNAIRKDRHTPTKYRAELAQLESIPEVGYVLKRETPDVQKEEPVVYKEEAVVQKDTSDVQNEEIIVQNDTADAEKESVLFNKDALNVQTETAIVQKEPPALSEPPAFTEDTAHTEPENSEPPAQKICPYAPPITLASGEEYRLLQRDVDVWRRKYTDVNITEELRKLRDYLEEHPDKRKTAEETVQYAEKWFSRLKNKTAGNGGKKKHLQDESPPSYDIDLAEYLMNTRVPKLRKKEK